jgi:hypothetical protein
VTKQTGDTSPRRASPRVDRAIDDGIFTVEEDPETPLVERLEQWYSLHKSED